MRILALAPKELPRGETGKARGASPVPTADVLQADVFQRTACQKTNAVRFGAANGDFNAIPVIDVGPLWNPAQAAQKAAVLEKLSEARHVGFMVIQNHGVPQALLQEAETQARAFFTLPTAEKMFLGRKPYAPESDNTYHGYFPVLNNETSYKEGIDMGPNQLPEGGAVPTHLPLFEPNLWPEAQTLPGFKPAMLAYYDAMQGLGLRMMNAFGEVLQLPPNHFDDKFNQSISTLRLLHYPPRPPESWEQMSEEGFADGAARQTPLACSEHTDTGVLTLLHQDGVGGLQVKNKRGQWIDVPAIKDSFVVNFGDVWSRWTNDAFPATPHRVVAQAQSRMSIPFFFEPNWDTVIEPVPSCVTPEQPTRYASVPYGPYMWEKIKAKFAEFRDLPN